MDERRRRALEAAGRWAASLWLDRVHAPPDPAPTELTRPGVAHVVARRAGRRRAAGWARGSSTAGALRRAVGEARSALEAPARAEVDLLEVVLGHGPRAIDPARDARPLSNVHRGLRGLEVRAGGAEAWISPLEMLATNRGFRRAVERWGEQAGLGAGVAPALRLYEADQLLVRLAPVEAVPLYRGNRVVPVERIDRPYVERLCELLAGWLVRNLQPDGRMVYKYWPSAGRESEANNLIRQWMATVALGRVAGRRADPALWERVAANIRYNLARFYREEAGLGEVVEAGDKVKLGAVALACLALVEHRDSAAFAVYERALLSTVEALWQPSGAFRTFLRPTDRDDNHNFYPGEALLLWASLLERAPDAALLARFRQSFRYYRAWHRASRNPAFVPWHTQAYFIVWRLTGEQALRDFTFEMNDWLLEVQQWDAVRDFPDLMGRFYDPARPFGPPHASSTGVYLEGLVDAWRMASAAGEGERADRYRRAIIRGLRSVAQLTFQDDVDMFYITRREKVRGGVRSNVYDNEIRVDNVQHNLMAILKVLEHLPPEALRP